MDRDLVRTAGRGDELGRPYLYATTKRFLQVFGLRHLDDLPRSDVLRASKPQPNPGGELAPDETASPPSGF
jgi:segregation and condensation protein B